MLDDHLYKSFGLQDILHKVLNRQRLSFQEALRLWDCENPLLLGQLAHLQRSRLHGRQTSYVLNQQINYTNICVNRCLFCSYRRQRGQPGAFELSLEEIRDKILSSLDQPISEIHIVGGCHPDLDLDYYLQLLALAKELRPEAALKCFTAVEIDHIARQEGLQPEHVLHKLQQAGLQMLPGGGAEIFDPGVRSRICPTKISAQRWLEICAAAHSLGIKTNCTMLFGHLETVQDRLSHLLKLRKQQDQSQGFVCFIPLPFQTENNPLQGVSKITGLEELKTIALSRLLLDNIPHIKSYWVMLGLKQAQAALYWGADDLDGTVVEERIGHMAGADSPQVLSRSQLEEMIQDCDLVPVQRNARFEQVSPA
ncbi:MAG: aminofutalosine synthase MqnE [Desulfohalobiaceae bacterium]